MPSFALRKRSCSQCLPTLSLRLLFPATADAGGSLLLAVLLMLPKPCGPHAAMLHVASQYSDAALNPATLYLVPITTSIHTFNAALYLAGIPQAGPFQPGAAAAAQHAGGAGGAVAAQQTGGAAALHVLVSCVRAGKGLDCG
eukprot:1159277-Pelagomonas_calceolata.AAC.7